MTDDGVRLPMDETTSLERLERMFTTPYNTEDSDIHALLVAFATEFDEQEETLDDILDQKFVETASGEYLNKIGSLFDFERRRNETEPAFRARIQTGLRAQMSSATIPEIKDISALILQTDTSEFELVEFFDIQTAAFALDVGEFLADAGLTPAEFIDIINNVTAAGVNVGILLSSDTVDVLTFEEEDNATYEHIQAAYWNEARVGVDFYV